MVTGLEAESLQTTAARERRLSRFAIPVIALVIGVGLGYVLAPKGSEAPTSKPVGPTRVESGVPVGYAQTLEGAVAAASNFEKVRSGPLLLDEDKYLRAIETMATEGWKQRGVESGRQAVETARSEFGENFTIDSSPIRYRMIDYSPNTARVAVWLVSVVAPAGHTPRQIWSTVEYELRWSGDWRVASAKSGETVVPAPFSETTSSSESSLDGFTGYRDAPRP